MATLRKLLLEVPPARPDDLGDALYERFKNEADTLIVPVIDDEHRPIGMLERHGFFLSMGATFGRAVLAGRPIRMQMVVSPPVVQADTSTAQFMDEQLQSRRRAEIDLRRAIQTGELELHYQPLLDLQSGGAAAVRRWCAGTIPSAAKCRRATSSHLPRTPA
jgi:hypothetical protein